VKELHRESMDRVGHDDLAQGRHRAHRVSSHASGVDARASFVMALVARTCAARAGAMTKPCREVVSALSRR
jgi:hypothetical protein